MVEDNDTIYTAGQFTIKHAGRYEAVVNVTLAGSAAGTARWLGWNVNGPIAALTTASPQGANPPSIQCVMRATQLAAGVVLAPAIYRDTGANLNLAADANLAPCWAQVRQVA